MPSNINPIYTRIADIQGGTLLGNITATSSALSASADYTGQASTNVPIFTADATNGGYIQKIRCKAAGTNSAVALLKIYLNEGKLNTVSPASSLAAVTPTGLPFTTGGTLLGGGTVVQNYFAKVQAIDSWGGYGILSLESAAGGVPIALGVTTGSITWSWTAATGPVAYYRVYVGTVAGGEYSYFDTTTATASYTQTAPFVAGQFANPIENTTTNMFIGEIALPTTSASSTLAGPEIDYILNVALPPGYRIIVGLHQASVQATGGWVVTVFGGKY